MHPTCIHPEEHQALGLDQLASDASVLQPEIMPELIDGDLGAVGTDLASDLAAIKESFGVFDASDIDIPPRGAGQRAEHLERIWSLTP